MILAILQARTSSRRLPGKVLRPLLGEPMMLRQIERLQRCRAIDHLVVATSIEPSDDAIEEVCGKADVVCRRGPLNDVLERFRLAAAPDNPEHIVRLTADCPLADWRVIDHLVALHLAGHYDYSSNARPRSYPHGLDCEIMTGDALQHAASSATTAYDREHVTPYLYAPQNSFRIGNLAGATDLSFLRWTVDEPEDFRFVEAIYQALYPRRPDFLTADIVQLLADRPELRFINSACQSVEDREKADQFWQRHDRKITLPES